MKSVSYAKKYGIATELICNGSMLTTNNIEKLLNNNLAKLTISVDGASKEVFEKIRVKSDFNQVIENGKNFKKMIAKKIVRPEFSAWSTIQGDNLGEVEEITKLCKEIGFDDLTFQVFLTGWGKDEWNEINSKKNINYENSKIKDTFEKVILKYSSNKFKVSVFEENLLTFEKKCSWPWNSAYLSAEGNVVPCCIIGDPEVVNMGNINSTSFKNIWNSEKYNLIRNNIKNNKLDNFCKNCYFETRKS